LIEPDQEIKFAGIYCAKYYVVALFVSTLVSRITDNFANEISYLRSTSENIITVVIGKIKY